MEEKLTLWGFPGALGSIRPYQGGGVVQTPEPNIIKRGDGGGWRRPFPVNPATPFIETLSGGLCGAHDAATGHTLHHFLPGLRGVHLLLAQEPAQPGVRHAVLPLRVALEGIIQLGVLLQHPTKADELGGGERLKGNFGATQFGGRGSDAPPANKHSFCVVINRGPKKSL